MIVRISKKNPGRILKNARFLYRFQGRNSCRIRQTKDVTNVCNETLKCDTNRSFLRVTFNPIATMDIHCRMKNFDETPLQNRHPELTDEFFAETELISKPIVETIFFKSYEFYIRFAKSKKLNTTWSCERTRHLWKQSSTTGTT